MTINSYIICTNPRSGSTLLCGLLAQTGVAGQPESFFRGPSRQWWADHLQVAQAVDLTDPAFCASFLSAVRAEGQGSGNLFGCRLMHESLADLITIASCVHPELVDDLARIKAMFGRTTFVHLIRKNKVEQAISYVRAEQTGTWHVAPDGRAVEQKGQPRVPHYDFDRIHQKVVEFEAQEAAWTRWFEQTGARPLIVQYSDLASDPKHELRRILNHLDLPANAADRATPGVRKLADALNREWVKRYWEERTKHAPLSLS